MMRATKWRDGRHFFSVIISNIPTPDIPFISRNIVLIFSTLILHVLLRRSLLLFSIIYTFKHELCQIHWEVSQKATYQCDNQNMSLCSLVSPWLEFHFITSKTIAFSYLFSIFFQLPQPLFLYLLAICPHAASSFEAESFLWKSFKCTFYARV